MNENPKKQRNPYIRFTAIALQMGLTIYLGNRLGIWLDAKYNVLYWETTLTLVAVFFSIYSVVKQVITFTKNQK